ncbi:hypothetical protein D3C72_2479220 [compost metagenome]
MVDEAGEQEIGQHQADAEADRAVAEGQADGRDRERRQPEDLLHGGSEKGQ